MGSEKLETLARDFLLQAHRQHIAMEWAASLKFEPNSLHLIDKPLKDAFLR